MAFGAHLGGEVFWRRSIGRWVLACALVSTGAEGAEPDPAPAVAAPEPEIAKGDAGTPSLAPEGSGESILREASAAYQAVNLVGARDLAQKALATGELSVSELTEAYRIIGDSYAILNQRDAARHAYLRLLAVAPRSVVSDELNPEMQVSFVEARSHWNHSGPGLEVLLVREEQSLVVSLTDPLEMVARVKVHTEGVSTFEQDLRRKDLPFRFPVPDNEGEIRYFLSAHDLTGNTVYEHGQPGAPFVIDVPREAERPAHATSPARTDEELESDGKKKNLLRSPVFWGIVGVVAAGVITGIVIAQDAPDRDLAVSARY